MTVQAIGTKLTDMSVKKQKKEATKASLLKAAIKVFREVGYAKARVSDIVAKAGVSQGTFYLYFKSKEDILRRIISSLKDNFNKALEDVDVIFVGETAEEMLHSLSMFLEKALAMHHENIGAAEIMWREGFGHGGVFAELYTETYSYFIEIIRARMKEAAARGLISCERIDDSAVLPGQLVREKLVLFHGHRRRGGYPPAGLQPGPVYPFRPAAGNENRIQQPAKQVSVMGKQASKDKGSAFSLHKLVMPLAKRLWLVLLLMAVVTAAAVYGMSFLTLENDLQNMMADENLEKIAFRDAEERYGDSIGMVLAFNAPEGLYRADFLERLEAFQPGGP